MPTLLKIEGEIGWETTAREFKNQLKDTTGELTLEISSPGGHVFQGVEIFNAVKAYDRGKVIAVIGSIAASMASYIALAADEVQAHDNSTYMIHNASAVAWGDHHALRKKADVVNGLSKMLAKAYMSKTGKSEKAIEKLMNAETFYYGDEMKDAGFVDVIITTEDDKDSESAKALAQENFSACLKSANERYTDTDFNEAVAMLEKVEESKPSKEDNSDEGEADNASKVNAINARLKLREKEIQL